MLGIYKLSVLKRFFLFALMVLIDMSYQTKLFAYSLTSGNRTNCNTANGYACSGYNAGVYLTAFQLNYRVMIESTYNTHLYGVLVSVNNGYLKSVCICLTAAEVNKLQSCNTTMGSCGFMGGGTVLNLIASKNGTAPSNTDTNHIECGAYRQGCVCAEGAYAAKNICAQCPTGYYCPGGVSVLYSKANGGSVSCPSPGTAASGAKQISSCYIPSGQNITESGTGHVYDYASNCYYAS